MPTVCLTDVRATATIDICAGKLSKVEIQNAFNPTERDREAHLWTQSSSCLQLSPSIGRKRVELRILASTLKDVYKKGHRRKRLRHCWVGSRGSSPDHELELLDNSPGVLPLPSLRRELRQASPRGEDCTRRWQNVWRSPTCCLGRGCDLWRSDDVSRCLVGVLRLRRGWRAVSFQSSSSTSP